MIVCRLSDILRERGLSRRALARQTALNINTICHWANGTLLTVDLRVLGALCVALHCQPGELLRWAPAGKQEDVARV